MIPVNKEKQITAILVLLAAALVILIVILASVPPVSRDALVHHLAIPKLWIDHGSIHEMPDKVFSYYPMTIDLLYWVPLYLGNDIIPKFIHFALALATSFLIFNYLKRLLHVNYALLGALFFLSTPIIVKLSITAYVDLGLVFFSTAALMFLLKWYADIPRMKYICLAGLVGGLALGTKYNGLIVMLLLVFLVFFMASRSIAQGRQTSLQALLCVVLFGVVATLIYAPWGIRNIIWTGNPIYPLFDQWFNPSSPYKTTAVPPVVLRKLLYGETWWEILLVPLRIFFQGVDDSPRYFDGRLNPALLILPVFAFITGRDNEQGRQEQFEKGLMLIFSGLFIFFVFFKTSMRIRYIAPVIPFLVILSIFGLRNVFALIGRHFNGGWKRLAAGLSLLIILLPFGLNAVYVIGQFKIIKPVQYLSGQISRDAYIEAFRPEYGVIKHANTHLPHDAKILALFIGKRGYYSNRDMLFDAGLLKTALEKSKTVEEMQLAFAGLGISHLLIRFDMFEDWRHNNLDFDDNKLVLDFLSWERAFIFERNGHGLYRLGDRGRKT